MWEPAGRSLLAQVEERDGRRVLDVGCGAMGLLRALSEWVGPHGTVVGTRFLLAPLGRIEAQLDAYCRLVRPGGRLVLEEPDSGSWHFNPPAEAAERLIALIVEAFAAAGGDFDAGRKLPALLRSRGVEPAIDAHVLALAAGHPYLRLPLQFASSLEQRLLELMSADDLTDLRARAEQDVDAARWGTSFTLIQAYGRVTR